MKSHLLENEEHDLASHCAACIERYLEIRARLLRIELIIGTAACGLIGGLVWVINLLFQLLQRGASVPFT